MRIKILVQKTDAIFCSQQHTHRLHRKWSLGKLALASNASVLKTNRRGDHCPVIISP